MKVHQLISHLKTLPQNIDIVFYNGLVQDVQPIYKEFIVEETRKYSLEYYIGGFKMDWHNNRKIPYSEKIPPDEEAKILEKAAKAFRSRDNKYKPHLLTLDGQYDVSSWYSKKSKKRVLLQAGRAGQTYYDRTGKIEY